MGPSLTLECWLTLFVLKSWGKLPVKHTFPLQLGNDMITSVGHYLKVSECLGLADKIVSSLSMTVNLGWKLVWYQRTMASGQPGRRTGRKSWILLGKNMISLKKGFFLIAITRNSALQSKNSLLVLHSLFSTLMILLWCSAKKKKKVSIFSFASVVPLGILDSSALCAGVVLIKSAYLALI